MLRLFFINNCRYILLVAILFLTACAEQPKKPVVLVPVEERHAPVNSDNTVIKKPGRNTVADKQKESVVIALLDDADNFAKKGQSSQAAAIIERALRIEPKNALLWHRLSQIRLQQQQWQQAIVMARKSNALAKGNTTLQSKNWGIIAQAYDKLGNKKKANEARNKQRIQS